MLGKHIIVTLLQYVAIMQNYCKGLRPVPPIRGAPAALGNSPVPRAQTPHRCPPCLGSGSATYWMLAGISWEASCGPLGGVLEASWSPFWCLLGPLLGLLEASWGLLGASWGLLGASWAPLGVTWGRRGAEGSNFRFGPPLLGTSWGRLGALLGASWAVLAPSGPSWGPLGSLLGRSWGPLGPSSTP